jgi:hypothetical protein
MILKPLKPKTRTVAKLLIRDTAVLVEFPEFSDEFRKLVKSLGFTWDGQRWQRIIGDLAGYPADRCAETGRDLIAGGFCVEFTDPAIESMAINGAFEPECKRWVMATTAGQFKIWWAKGEDYYKLARRITASRYSRPCVVVPPEHFEEILDFARIHDFKLTKKAYQLIEKTTRKQDDAMIVDFSPRREPANGKRPILSEPDEIIPDELKDDPL